MIPQQLQKRFSSPALGLILIVLSLFFIADTFYLNTVRDAKAANLEIVANALDAYQTGLSAAKKPSSLLPYTRPFHYGNFLQDALPAFQIAGRNVEITEIHLNQIEVADLLKVNDASSSSMKSKRNHKKMEFLLTLNGQFMSQVNQPFQNLNTIINQIYSRTDCHLSLNRSEEKPVSDTQGSVGPESLQFELRLKPQGEKKCWARYTRPVLPSEGTP